MCAVVSYARRSEISSERQIVEVISSYLIQWKPEKHPCDLNGGAVNGLLGLDGQNLV